MDEHLCKVIAHDRVVGQTHVRGRCQQLLERPTGGTAVATGLGVVPFEAERRQRHLPTLTDRAEAEIVSDSYVGEEHLAERRAAAHLADRADLDTLGVHRKHECRHALVLGLVRIGARDQLTEMTELGARTPHLLPVDDPLVAVTDGAAGQAGEVGAGTRLAEQLARQNVAPQERADETGLLLVGSEHVDCVRDQARRDPDQLVPARGLELTLEPAVCA